MTWLFQLIAFIAFAQVGGTQLPLPNDPAKIRAIANYYLNNYDLLEPKPFDLYDPVYYLDHASYLGLMENRFERPYLSLETMRTVYEVIGDLTVLALQVRTEEILNGHVDPPKSEQRSPLARDLERLVTFRSDAERYSLPYLDRMGWILSSKADDEFKHQYAETAAIVAEKLIDALTVMGVSYRVVPEKNEVRYQASLIAVQTLRTFADKHHGTPLAVKAIRALDRITQTSPAPYRYFDIRIKSLITRLAPYDYASKALSELALKANARETGLACAKILLSNY